MAVTYIVSNTAVTTSANQLYTVPTQAFAQTAGTFLYTRDLVVSNGGTATVFVGLSTSGTVATSLASFQIPSGGSVLLTNCQVPAGAVLSALTGAGTSTLSVGYSTNPSL